MVGATGRSPLRAEGPRLPCRVAARLGMTRMSSASRCRLERRLQSAHRRADPPPTLSRRACDVLIVYLSFGSGHRMAAEALAAAFADRAPHVRVAVHDLLQGSDSWRFRRLSDVYGTALHLVPWAYDWAWWHARPGLFNGLAERASCGKALNHFRGLLAAARPRVVICTHALAARFAVRLQKADTRFLHVGILTDFGCHEFWPRQGVDLYITPSAEVRAEGALGDVPARRIHPLGIPVRRAFWQQERRSASLGREQPLVVVLAGSTDRRLYTPAAQAARELTDAHAQDPSAFSLTVVTGRDEPLRRRLADMPAALDCRVLGYVDDMGGLLRQASVLVTKPGGLATAEALAAGVPLVYVGPALGQERANVQFTSHHGAAVHTQRPGEVADTLRTLLAGPARLGHMAEQAQRLGRPKAALRVVDLIVRTAGLAATHRAPTDVCAGRTAQEESPCSML